LLNTAVITKEKYLSCDLQIEVQIYSLGLFCLLLAAFILICCCRWNNRRRKIKNGKRRTLSLKRKEQVTRDELVVQPNIYDTGINPIFRIPTIEDKGPLEQSLNDTPPFG